jgi:hypothetical protein
VNILGVTVLGLPALLRGARVVPKRRKFDRIVRTVRVEQPAVTAISLSLGEIPFCDLLRIISRISRCCDSAILGAIVNTPRLGGGANRQLEECRVDENDVGLFFCLEIQALMSDLGVTSIREAKAS